MHRINSCCKTRWVVKLDCTVHRDKSGCSTIVRLQFHFSASISMALYQKSSSVLSSAWEWGYMWNTSFECLGMRLHLKYLLHCLLCIEATAAAPAWEWGYSHAARNTLLHCLCALCLRIKLMWLCHPSPSGSLLMVNKNYKQCTRLDLRIWTADE